ncbi:Condensin-2 complex subunit H2 [Apostasia shenzhenica]|uniref:Condensin-2 complex subunit H2 n=1 Tax=Apostasia shenzhenica TaxID=1088818 RepID=A0A2H9ZTV4_9ASPA|nr:Condensin-2 complex subunit H2 [Apostasia shenzhenica]
MSDREEPFEAGGGSSGIGGRIHFLQPNRDLKSNWEVDLAKKLEEYLLKICAGEVSSDQSVNFAEAALLLQGSVQVYSRKVEYLYSLVLHALDFLSQKRQDQQEKSSTEPVVGVPGVVDEESEIFLGLDDVPVESKIQLDDGVDRHDFLKHCLKAPASLLVLEGDCLNTTGDANELDSYLLATCDFYGDFLLLDPCDVAGIDSFLENNAVDHVQASNQRDASLRSKTHETSFLSPNKSSNGSAKRSIGNDKSQNNHGSENNGLNQFSEPYDGQRYSGEDMCHADEPYYESADVRDDSDEDDDPWKPLNPHEPGNLKIKPFRKGKIRQISPSSRRKTLTSQFPLAKLDGIISPEFAESFEVKLRLQETQNKSESPPLFEKLRGSFSFGEHGSFDFIDRYGDEDQEDGGENDFPDYEQAEGDLGMEAPSFAYKGMDDTANCDVAGTSSLDDLDSDMNLEELCKIHLDSLLATIAEPEKQTGIAARVSTWKQRIEQTLEEKDKHPAFDIHRSGERIMEKISLEADDNGVVSFTDLVAGQPMHEIARSFSALLQLVNNGDVDLQRAPSAGGIICHTAENPFHIKLLQSEWGKVQVDIPSTKKRVPPPLSKGGSEALSPLKPPRHSGKPSVKLKMGGLTHYTPQRKRRRKSTVTENLPSAADI